MFETGLCSLKVMRALFSKGADILNESVMDRALLAYSWEIRPPVPTESGHVFRLKAATISDSKRQFSSFHRKTWPDCPEWLPD